MTNSYSDDLKPQVTVSRAGVTTSNVFDAADRVIATYRYPDGQPIQAALVSSNTYNTAGELVSTTDARTNTTSHAHWTDADGYVWRQTTYPDGSYRKEQSYRDGQLHSVTGTAVHAARYNYRVETVNGYGVLVTRETKLDGATEKEWTETWTDGNGRTLKTVRSDASNANGIPASQSFYNDKGQLERQVDADGVTTLFGYNAAGEQIVSAIDMDQNGAISGADRVSSNATSIVSAHGTTVLRRETWQINDSGTFTLVSTSDTTGDGLRSWQTSFELTSSSVTAYTDRFHAERTVTTTAPDGSTTISIYREGRLLSTTRKDAAGTQLSAVSYQYDGLGRQRLSSEQRGGVTVSVAQSFNAADQVIATTNAVGLAEEQTTRFDYDTMGRRTNTVMTDGAQTHVSYLLTGEPSTNWGDRTYPVAYTYDHAGRMKTMTTWQDYAGKTGAAVTTWNYDPNTGQLISKKYPLPVGEGQGEGPSYGYTPAGRLLTRSWARGVVTTYAYNNAGDLASVAYTDGTPGVTNTYNRLGRRTSVSSAPSAVSYSYSDSGQLLAEIHTTGPLAGLTVTNSYDALMRRSSVGVLTSDLRSLTSVGILLRLRFPPRRRLRRQPLRCLRLRPQRPRPRQQHHLPHRRRPHDADSEDL